MKWVLVFIYLYEGNPFAMKVDSFDNMMDCFVMREQLSIAQEGPRPGTFPLGQQALCIQRNDDETYG